MIFTKEKLIDRICESLLVNFSIDEVNEIKETLIIEMRNIELKECEQSLIVQEDELIRIIRKFIACKKLSGCTERSIEFYLSELSMFFKEMKKNIKDINSDDIRIYLSIYKKKKLSDVTVDNKRRILNSFFDWCLNEEYITRNPVKKVGKIKKENKIKEAFTELEIERMRSYLANNKGHKGRLKNIKPAEIRLRNIAIFETLLSTGCRIAELVQIDRSQVENNQNSLKILGKGRKERIVYLNPKARISILNYLNERKDFEEALFVSENPFDEESKVKRMSIAGIEIMIRELGKKNNIKAYPHKFRRTLATMASRKGMPVEQIQKMLGHAGLNTTQIYLEVQNDDIKLSHEKYIN